MKNIFWLILIINFSHSCTDPNPKPDRLYIDEYYSVLDNILRFSIQDVSAISYETVLVYKTIWGLDSIPNYSISPPPPPPPMINYVDVRHIKYVLKRNNLDTLDAYVMYKSIDSTKKFRIDQKRIAIPIITREQFLDFFKSDIDEGYDKIRENFGTSCYIRSSTPIFNADYTKMILFIDCFCGSIWGQGYEFFLIKKDGKWSIIEENGTWES